MHELGRATLCHHVDEAGVDLLLVVLVDVVEERLSHELVHAVAEELRRRARHEEERAVRP
jgi:hypothetical protein